MKQETEHGYSPEVAGILTRKPRWIVRNGTLLAGLVFLVGLFITTQIPYPEVLNCEMDVVSPSLDSVATRSVEGIIRLPSGYASVVRPGMTARVILPDEKRGNPEKIDGKITCLFTNSSTNFFSAKVVLPSDGEQVKSMMRSTRVNVQIIVGKTSLFQEIFQPILSLLSRDQM
ncbi:MAG TPA: hypothetical protein PKJ28_03495 [Bacteroidales bacterium]|nr:hypothetical protein [Bacteroidales bacterium]HPS73167.1 hypothetical protein [Bacteroidales bacterium]